MSIDGFYFSFFDPVVPLHVGITSKADFRSKPFAWNEIGYVVHGPHTRRSGDRTVSVQYLAGADHTSVRSEVQVPGMLRRSRMAKGSSTRRRSASERVSDIKG